MTLGLHKTAKVKSSTFHQTQWCSKEGFHKIHLYYALTVHFIGRGIYSKFSDYSFNSIPFDVLVTGLHVLLCLLDRWDILFILDAANVTYWSGKITDNKDDSNAFDSRKEKTHKILTMH